MTVEIPGFPNIMKIISACRKTGGSEMKRYSWVLALFLVVFTVCLAITVLRG